MPTRVTARCTPAHVTAAVITRRKSRTPNSIPRNQIIYRRWKRGSRCAVCWFFTRFVSDKPCRPLNQTAVPMPHSSSQQAFCAFMLRFVRLCVALLDSV